MIRVMTWNIRTGIGSGPRVPDAGVPPDLESIVGVIDHLRPDVVALQEVDRHRDRTGLVDQAAMLAEALAMEVRFAANLVDNSGEYGVATLSSHPITASSHVLHPRCEGWDPRGVLDVVVRLGERQIRVLNTHLQVDRGDDEDAAIQREDGAQALALRMRGASEPVVLMGDFNADPGDLELRPLSGLADAWAEKGEGSGATIPASPAEDPSRRIDAILVDQRLRVRSCAVIRTPRTALASDHYPVVTDLAFVP
jgi:endonuclease/exonuclease/phosphatase family metal-dependent hydrolase